ncbi:hypothetical protein P4K96_18150, partial [Bacillus cereus]|nr:hypothetical protein [Bacillus cereus]
IDFLNTLACAAISCGDQLALTCSAFPGSALPKKITVDRTLSTVWNKDVPWGVLIFCPLRWNDKNRLIPMPQLAGSRHRK